VPHSERRTRPHTVVVPHLTGTTTLQSLLTTSCLVLAHWGQVGVIREARRVLGSQAQWYENMTSSEEREVHNVSQRRQKRTDPRPQATCTQNLVNFGCAVFELREQTNRQTDKQAYSSQYFALLPEWGGEVITITVHQTGVQRVHELVARTEKQSSRADVLKHAAEPPRVRGYRWRWACELGYVAEDCVSVG